jgi:4-diphosphocytidyl-2-C-methyl-D-erythritol kinase
LGLKLGADVPFFLGGHNAWVSGIGEKMTPVVVPEAQFVVVKPPQGVATERIFSHPELKRDTNHATISGFAANAYSFGCNDLQAVAQQICPGVSQALAWLNGLGLDGRMTGSGSAVFARTLCEIDTQAMQGFQVKQCGNLSVHPLFGWAG